MSGADADADADADAVTVPNGIATDLVFTITNDRPHPIVTSIWPPAPERARSGRKKVVELAAPPKAATLCQEKTSWSQGPSLRGLRVMRTSPRHWRRSRSRVW